MAQKKLKILFFSPDAYGHINPCIGVAKQLQERGHEIIFIIKPSFIGKLKEYGFKEEILQIQSQIDKDSAKDNSENKQSFHMKKFMDLGLYDNIPVFKKAENFILSEPTLLKEKYLNVQIKEIIQRNKPDIIIISFLQFPAILTAGCPWVTLMPANPLMAYLDERAPPSCSGLSSYDKTEWPKYQELWLRKQNTIGKRVNDYLIENGASPRPEKLYIHSPYLNLYGFIKELDYTDLRPMPDNWHRVDTFIKPEHEDDDFELPEKLKQIQGKLIYFSLGSMGSSNVELMIKLVKMLSELPYRFIISKGVQGDQFELPSNCWGEKIIPQTKVVPKVDLVITHGGNNTISETFYFGKPMIVMPLFADQFDNAQRVEDKKFGIRLNPFECTKDELANAIEKLVNDNDLQFQLNKISERIKIEVKSGKICQLIEGLIMNTKSV